MSDNPYLPPAHPVEDVPQPAVDLARLRGIAQTQRWVNRWALALLVTFLCAQVLFDLLPGNRHWHLAKVIVGGSWVAFLLLAVFVGTIQLAYRTKGLGTALVVGLVSWIPWANLVAAGGASIWATKMLKAAGFKVGILGVRDREFEKASGRF